MNEWTSATCIWMSHKIYSFPFYSEIILPESSDHFYKSIFNNILSKQLRVTRNTKKEDSMMGMSRTITVTLPLGLQNLFCL